MNLILIPTLNRSLILSWQRCVCKCVSAWVPVWNPAGCSSDEMAHKWLPLRSHATQSVQSDLRVSARGGVRGADGIGATVAEPLRLIAALDKEKYLIGNQSCGLRGFQHVWWTMDWSTCLSGHQSLRGLMGFWQQMCLCWRFQMTCKGGKTLKWTWDKQTH